MPDPSATSDAARWASFILIAWNTGDLHQLESALERAADSCARPASTTLETERRELLAGVADRLRDDLGPKSGPLTGTEDSQQVCLNLLQHLAVRRHPNPSFPRPQTPGRHHRCGRQPSGGRPGLLPASMWSSI